MKGAVSRPNPGLSVILVVGAAVLSFVGSQFTGLHLLGEGPFRDPIYLLTGLMIAASAGWIGGLLDFLGSQRIPEIVEGEEGWRVHLGWRTVFERHGPVGGLIAAVALLGWWMSHSDPVWMAGSVVQAILVSVGMLGVFWLYIKDRSTFSLLTITSESIDVDGLTIPRASIVSVERVGLLGRNTRINRSDGPPIVLDMRGNRPATQDLLLRILEGEEEVGLSRAAATQRLARKPGGGFWTTFAGWWLAFPLTAIATGLSFGWMESVTQVHPKGTLLMVLISLVWSVFIALPFSLRRTLHTLVERPDRLRWSPAAEGLLPRALTLAWLAWSATVMLHHLVLGLDLASVGVGLIGLVLGLVLVGTRARRRRLSEVVIDTAGVALKGKSSVRIPWSELVGVAHRRGLFPALVLETADGSKRSIAVGGADAGELARVLEELRSRLVRVEPATEAERKQAARAARLGRSVKG